MELLRSPAVHGHLCGVVEFVFGAGFHLGFYRVFFLCFFPGGCGAASSYIWLCFFAHSSCVLNFEFLYCDDNNLVWRAAQQAPITCSLTGRLRMWIGGACCVLRPGDSTSLGTQAFHEHTCVVA